MRHEQLDKFDKICSHICEIKYAPTRSLDCLSNEAFMFTFTVLVLYETCIKNDTSSRPEVDENSGVRLYAI